MTTELLIQDDHVLEITENERLFKVTRDGYGAVGEGSDDEDDTSHDRASYQSSTFAYVCEKSRDMLSLNRVYIENQPQQDNTIDEENNVWHPAKLSPFDDGNETASTATSYLDEESLLNSTRDMKDEAVYSETTVTTGAATTTEEAQEDNKFCRGLYFPGWKAYNQSLDEHPLATKAFTSLVGWFLGDFVTQVIITGGPFDIRRSVTLASFGFFFHGPAGHVLYGGLDQLISGREAKHVILKIIVDQLIWCPIFMIIYFSYLGVANGETFAMLGERIQSDLYIAVKGSWKVWPLAHAINFRFVQTKHRIIYINCIEVCFIMFLSFLGNQ